MHVAIITAGGAGMFCGSCMHDNTWARALLDAGVDVTLIPTYTPIRVDEDNVSSQRVFFGGINIYLEHHWPMWRRMPRWLTRWLDHPSVIRFATRRAVSNDAAELGDLTLSMLAGESGPHAADVRELVQFVARDLRPDVVCFSNVLLCGALRELRREFRGPLFCTLQGDDIFLNGLPEPVRKQVIEAISERAGDFDGFVTHADFYRDDMAGLLNLPVEKFHHLPLGISFAGHDGAAPSIEPHRDPSQSDLFTQASELPGGEFRIGYFARICPEKGLDRLVDAVRSIRRRHAHVRLVAGGYLGSRDVAWFERLSRDASDLGDAFEYIGSPPDHAAKVAFLKSLDVLSVPTVYHEPKGLYVLEALANGVPVVQPAHGSFPHIIELTGGGLLYSPDRPDELVAAFERMIVEPDLRRTLAVEGHRRVREEFSPERMAERTIALFEPFLHKATAVAPEDAPDDETP